MILYLIKKNKTYDFIYYLQTYVSHKLMQKRNQNVMSKSETKI